MRKLNNKKPRKKREITVQNMTLDDITTETLGIIVDAMNGAGSNILRLKCEFNTKDKSKYNVDLFISKEIEKLERPKVKKVEFKSSEMRTENYTT